jgi:hyperosmotically inducible protein
MSARRHTAGSRDDACASERRLPFRLKSSSVVVYNQSSIAHGFMPILFVRYFVDYEQVMRSHTSALWHGSCLLPSVSEKLSRCDREAPDVTKGDKLMKIRRNLLNAVRTIVALTLLSLTLGNYTASAAPTRDQLSGQQMLNKNVRHALVMLPWFGVFDNLEYRLNGNEVVLSGQVVQPVLKHDAEKAVQHVEGVTHVVNNITVLPLSNFDDQIRRAEYRAIFSQPGLARYSMGAVPSVHIIVSNGHVTLTGMVGNQMDYNIARIRALSVPGVFSVTNNLRIG